MRLRTAMTAALGAAATGLTAVLVVTSPAAAAAAPTISAPSTRTGYGTVTITGTAPAGSTVTLHESAYNWNDLQVAEDWQGSAGPVTATAGSEGKYQIVRYVDTGFLFAVEAGGLMSATALVRVQALPLLTATSPGAGRLEATVVASPNQPHLRTRLQRADTGGVWTTVADGYTNDLGVYAVSLTSQGSGTRSFRALIDADTTTAITSGSSSTVAVSLGGTAAPTPTPKPTPAAQPAAGSVQFTQLRYDSAGRDTRSNASINGEWFRLTNKTKKTINLKSWTVRDVAGHLYRFSSDYSLGAGKNVYVHTGKGTNGKPAGRRYWGSANYVWNNSGDTATLRSSANKTIDTCKWTSDRDITTC